jgi:predicted RecA/RadA family phage recombinase
MNAIFRGEAGIPYTASGNVSAGDIIPVGSKLVGVALRDMVSGDSAILRSNGQFDVLKATTGVSFAAGATVYWNTSTKTAVASSGSNVITLGFAVEAAAEAAAVVRVNLYQLN